LELADSLIIQKLDILVLFRASLFDLGLPTEDFKLFAFGDFGLGIITRVILGSGLNCE